MSKEKSAGRDGLRDSMREYVKATREVLFALFNVQRAFQGVASYGT